LGTLLHELVRDLWKLKGPGAASDCGRPQGPPGPCLWRSQHWV